MSIFTGGFFGGSENARSRFREHAPGDVQDVFRIEEKGGLKRVLRLQGRSLPYRPVSWTGTQRMKTSWYPGNPEATQQVLGPKEEPTEVEGWLRSRYLATGTDQDQGDPAILKEGGSITKLDTPEKVRDVLDSMRHSGQPLRVSWGGIIRIGRIQKAEFPHDRLEDIGYKLMFEWKSRGQKVARANASRRFPETSLLESLFDAVADAINAIESVLNTIDVVKENIILGARAVQAAVSRVAALVDRIGGAITAPLDITQALIATFVNIRATIRNTSNGIASIPAEFMSTSDDVDQILESFNSIQLARFEMELVGADSYRQEQARLATIKPMYLDVVVGREGQSLRDLARRYYGDPDAWEIIADANGLDGAILEGGEILIIPVQP